jgi:hypothetical protein
MKKSKYSGEQIIEFLKQAKPGCAEQGAVPRRRL